jgi:transcriptional regulator with XRE-family HTH domain
MNAKQWAARELNELRHDPEFELEMLLLDVNERILARMNDLGWRKVDLANRLGVSRAFVTKLLNGNDNIKLGTLIRIANALGSKVEIEMLPRHVVEFLELQEFDGTEEVRWQGLGRSGREVGEGDQIGLAA